MRISGSKDLETQRHSLVCNEATPNTNEATSDHARSGLCVTSMTLHWVGVRSGSHLGSGLGGVMGPQPGARAQPRSPWVTPAVPLAIPAEAGCGGP